MFDDRINFNPKRVKLSDEAAGHQATWTTTASGHDSSPVIWHQRPSKDISCLFPEILSMIFEYLSVEDKGSVAQVCRTWRDAAYHKSVWKGVEAKLHLKRFNSSLFSSLVRRGIKNVQILSLQKGLKEVILGVPNIEKLTLTGCYNLTDEKVMSAFGQSTDSLVELNLSMCKQITDKSIQKVSQNLKSLKTLDLSGCTNITNNALLIIRLELKKLKRLNLRSCRNITDLGLAKLSGLYSDLDSSEKESMTSVAEAEMDLSFLGLQDCQKLTDEALKYISTGLKSLESINLSFCSGITEFGLKHLSTVSSLKEVNLRRCSNLTDTAIKYLCEANLKLTTLDISFCDKISDQSLIYISQGLSLLRNFSLNSCSVTDEGVVKVSLSELMVLNIGQCHRLTDKALHALADNCPNLKTIDLYGCNRITTIGLERIMQLPHLTVLNLGLWQNSNQSTPGPIPRTKRDLKIQELYDRRQSKSHLHHYHQQQQQQQQQQQHRSQSQQIVAVSQQNISFIDNHQFLYRDCILTKLCDSCQNVNFLFNNSLTGSPQYYLLLRVCKS